MRDFFRFGHTKQWIKVDYASAIKGPRQFALETLPFATKWEDVVKLVDYYGGDSIRDIRNQAIILLLITYGLRSSELSNMKLTDIDWNNDLISLCRVKRSKSQILPLSPTVGNAIFKYLKKSRKNDLGRENLFLNLCAPYGKLTRGGIYNIVSQAYRELGLKPEHYGAHSLRHACASRLINSGHTLKEVADLLGHRQLDTTRIYAKIDMINLRKVGDLNWEDLL